MDEAKQVYDPVKDKQSQDNYDRWLTEVATQEYGTSSNKNILNDALENIHGVNRR